MLTPKPPRPRNLEMFVLSGGRQRRKKTQETTCAIFDTRANSRLTKPTGKGSMNLHLLTWPWLVRRWKTTLPTCRTKRHMRDPCTGARTGHHGTILLAKTHGLHTRTSPSACRRDGMDCGGTRPPPPPHAAVHLEVPGRGRLAQPAEAAAPAAPAAAPLAPAPTEELGAEQRAPPHEDRPGRGRHTQRRRGNGMNLLPARQSADCLCSTCAAHPAELAPCFTGLHWSGGPGPMGRTGKRYRWGAGQLVLQQRIGESKPHSRARPVLQAGLSFPIALSPPRCPDMSCSVPAAGSDGRMRGRRA